jgi:hypothetical protein
MVPASRAKVAILAALALAAPAVAPQARQAHRPVLIKIMLVDGNSGKLIKNGSADVWIGAAEPDTPAIWNSGYFVGGEKYGGLDPVRSRRDGAIVFAVKPEPGRWIDVIAHAPFASRQCEPHIYFFGLAYPLADVLQHGIVSDNVCGKARAVPVPGTLVIYIRHETFWEKLRR